jgi:clan AA aspartic protease (TIGR02281 family)
MKYIFTFFLVMHFCITNAQVVIQMEKENNTFKIPCKINGIDLKFIFDTGASDVSISLTEALFMIKNGFLSSDDIIGTEYYKIANGDIQEGTKIIIRLIEIGGLRLYNVEAGIVHATDSPLLLGQSAISKFGKIQIDYTNNTLTVLGEKNDVYHTDKNKYSDRIVETERSVTAGKYERIGNRDEFLTNCWMWKSTLSTDMKTVYNIPKGSVVFVIKSHVKTDMDDNFLYVYCNGYYGYIEDYKLE